MGGAAIGAFMLESLPRPGSESNNILAGSDLKLAYGRQTRSAIRRDCLSRERSRENRYRSFAANPSQGVPEEVQKPAEQKQGD